MEKLTKEELYKKTNDMAIHCSDSLLCLILSIANSDEDGIKDYAGFLDYELDDMVKCIKEINKRLD